MTILVTGGAGYIGSHMAFELLDSGEDVIVLDDLSTGFAWAVPNRAKLVEGDVGDEELVKRLLSRYRVDAVMHFAGSVVVPESIRQPLLYYGNNTCKSRALIEATIEFWREAFHFFLDGSSLWHHRMRGDHGKRQTRSPLPLRQVEADDRDHAERCRTGT